MLFASDCADRYEHYAVRSGGQDQQDRLDYEPGGRIVDEEEL